MKITATIYYVFFFPRVKSTFFNPCDLYTFERGLRGEVKQRNGNTQEKKEDTVALKMPTKIYHYFLYDPDIANILKYTTK